MSDIVFLPAYQIAQMIRDRAVSATEVLQAFLTQIVKHNPKINAICTLDEENALKRARKADEALTQGENWGVLHGVPITVKDYFATALLRTTSSYKPLANYIPKTDATVVARSRQAGAIILAKTNMPELAVGPQTNSPLFGRANNPWNLERTPGGSSGGSAAAVAAGLSPLDLAGDGGGSIRIPAHFCGVLSLMPTQHRVSSAGLVRSQPGLPNNWHNLASYGPIARSVEDLRLTLSVIEGNDNRTWEVPPPPKENVVEKSLKKLRFAWIDNFGNVPVTQDTRNAMQNFTRQLESVGCRVEYIQPQNWDLTNILETFGIITAIQGNAEVSWIQRLGYKYLSLVAPLFDNSAFIRGMTKGLANDATAYIQALNRRDEISAQLEIFLSDWDGWICPVTPGVAFTHRQVNNLFGVPIEVDEQKLSYWTWSISYTAPFSLTGNPVVTLPIAQNQEGLPIGIQLVGKRWQDYQLLAVAQKVFDVVGGFKRPIGY